MLDEGHEGIVMRIDGRAIEKQLGSRGMTNNSGRQEH